MCKHNRESVCDIIMPGYIEHLQPTLDDDMYTTPDDAVKLWKSLRQKAFAYATPLVIESVPHTDQDFYMMVFDYISEKCEQTVEQGYCVTCGQEVLGADI